MDTEQYLDIFIDESTEHIDVLYKQLLELEKSEIKNDMIEKMFRSAHTLKGMSATMGFNDLANLTHHLEDVFDGIRDSRLSIQLDMVDVLFDTVDHLNAIIHDIASGGDGKRDVTLAITNLENINNTRQRPNHQIAHKQEERQSLQVITTLDEFEMAILDESIELGFYNYEVTVVLNEDCLLKGARVFIVLEVLERFGEVIKSEPSINDLEDENFDLTFTVLLVSKYEQTKIIENINKVSEIDKFSVHSFSLSVFKQVQKDALIFNHENKLPDKSSYKEDGLTRRKTMRVNIDRLDTLMNLFEELVIERGRLEQISEDLSHSDLQETVERMAQVSGHLQDVLLNMRMIPIEQVFNRFPHMIRQLSRELGKEVKLTITGADTELDRTVIDEIGDPLIHLIRNAVDHGIELPAVRISNGKQEQGTIELYAYHSGNEVFIEITDDGAGIDKNKVVKKAINNQIISRDQSKLLTDNQIYDLILESGFSTSNDVSDISGRGVGLDVVKNTIETLGGNISIHSKLNEGSVFSIQLPLTLSIMSVLLIELAREIYAIPLSSIIETNIIHKNDMYRTHSKQVIDFRGRVIPLTYLSELFELTNDDESHSDYVSIVIVKKGNEMTGLVVHSFIGQQEVVLKPLGTYLQNTHAISGATILGDGQVALIIDTNDLID